LRFALSSCVTDAPAASFSSSRSSARRWRASRSDSVVGLKPNRFYVDVMIVLVEGVYLKRASYILMVAFPL